MFCLILSFVLKLLNDYNFRLIFWLRSRDWTAPPSVVFLFMHFQLLTTLARWQGALSSWNQYTVFKFSQDLSGENY